MDARIPFLLLALLAAAPAAADDFKVVASRDVPVDSLSRDQLSQIFLKTSTRWPDGRTIRPVELRGEVPARQRFSEQVHGKAVTAIRAYWNKQIFSGREVPPVEKPSDEEVVAYVRSNDGAVGVVSASASTGGTKVVRVTD